MDHDFNLQVNLLDNTIESENAVFCKAVFYFWKRQKKRIKKIKRKKVWLLIIRCLLCIRSMIRLSFYKYVSQSDDAFKYNYYAAATATVTIDNGALYLATSEMIIFIPCSFCSVHRHQLYPFL